MTDVKMVEGPAAQRVLAGPDWMLVAGTGPVARPSEPTRAQSTCTARASMASASGGRPFSPQSNPRSRTNCCLEGLGTTIVAT